MKISSFIKLSTTIILLILGALSMAIYQAQNILDSVTRSETHRFRSLQLAGELLQSSDDLTRMARTYVITGNPIYEDHFFAILDIRNGKRPRPQNYSSTYWHLAGVNRAPVGMQGDTVSLQELMRREGINDQEFELLRRSQEYSDKLVNMEKQAFAAMKGLFDDGHGNFTLQRAPDRDFAISLLYGEQYSAEKARIMLPLEQFMRELDTRTQIALTELQEQLRQQILIVLMLIGIASAGVATSVFYLRRNVLQPLSYLDSQTIAVAAGNYTARCNIQTNNELARLGASFNFMAEAIERDIEVREQAEMDLLHAKENAESISAELTAYIGGIGKLALVSVTDRSGRILQANARFCEVSGYSEAELLGQDHRVLNSGTHPKEFFVEMWETITRGDIWHQEICNRSKRVSSIGWVRPLCHCKMTMAGSFVISRSGSISVRRKGPKLICCMPKKMPRKSRRS